MSDPASPKVSLYKSLSSSSSPTQRWMTFPDVKGLGSCFCWGPRKNPYAKQTFLKHSCGYGWGWRTNKKHFQSMFRTGLGLSYLQLFVKTFQKKDTYQQVECHWGCAQALAALLRHTNPGVDAGTKVCITDSFQSRHVDQQGSRAASTNLEQNIIS